MRLLFIILAIANVLAGLFIWSGGRQAESVRIPPPEEIAPERIRLIGRDADAPSALTQTGRACVEWGAFALADAQRAVRQVEHALAVARFSERRVETGEPRYWVHVPPLANRRAAEGRVSELRRLGLSEDEMFVVQEEGRFANAISLGLFANEAGAVARRDALQRLGVEGVEIVPRGANAARVFLRFVQVSSADFRALSDLRRRFPGTEIRDCAEGDKAG